MADVEQRVRVILHLAAEQSLSEEFVVERHEAGLYVELRGADATLIGQRTLPLEGSCEELAQAAAVVLSAWLTDVHPDFASALPAPAPVLEQPATAPEPPAPEPPPPPTPPPTPRTEQRPSTSRRYLVDLSLGAGADFADKKLAPAGLVSAAYVPERSGLGGAVWLSVDPSRREPLATGSVAWRRWPVGIGPTYRWSTRRLFVDVSAGPAIAWLHLRGANFTPSYAHNAATWAGFANLRLASRGKVAVFGLSSTQYYVAKSTAYVGGAEYGLPRWSTSLFIGVSVSP